MTSTSANSEHSAVISDDAASTLSWLSSDTRRTAATFRQRDLLSERTSLSGTDLDSLAQEFIDAISLSEWMEASGFDSASTIYQDSGDTPPTSISPPGDEARVENVQDIVTRRQVERALTDWRITSLPPLTRHPLLDLPLSSPPPLPARRPLLDFPSPSLPLAKSLLFGPLSPEQRQYKDPIAPVPISTSTPTTAASSFSRSPFPSPATWNTSWSMFLNGTDITRPSQDNPRVQSFMVPLVDPTWKVLPVALRKCKIDDWQNYVMFISHGPEINRLERCLSYDEKPLLLFHRLRNACENPKFILKHIKDIRSPTATAQQERALRKTSMSAFVGAQACKRPVSSESLYAVANIPVSYAVAIYPYWAEQDHELNVTVGDTFDFIYRTHYWWFVRHHSAATVVVIAEDVCLSSLARQGWVPAGCLLQTREPLARATEYSGGGSGVGRVQILPLSIANPSFPGYALMDYSKKSGDELDLAKDDAVRVFKQYNHWYYAIKEDGGGHGWVPSWYISKITSVE